jgi:hypothetical protein
MIDQSHLEVLVHICLVLVQVLTMMDPDRVLDPFHVNNPMVIEPHIGALVGRDIILDYPLPDVAPIDATCHAHLLQDV